MIPSTDEFGKRGSTPPNRPTGDEPGSQSGEKHADPSADEFECEACHKVLDIEDSVRDGRKGPLLCPECARIIQSGTPDLNQAARDSTNESLYEKGLIEPEDL
jgi:hypothetical protein